MGNLEITKKCAQAMGIAVSEMTVNGAFTRLRVDAHTIYDPIHDDAQAMAMLKKFRLASYWVDGKYNMWVVSGDHRPNGENADLNCAICECVAKMERP